MHTRERASERQDKICTCARASGRYVGGREYNIHKLIRAHARARQCTRTHPHTHARTHNQMLSPSGPAAGRPVGRFLHNVAAWQEGRPPVTGSGASASDGASAGAGANGDGFQGILVFGGEDVFGSTVPAGENLAYSATDGADGFVSATPSGNGDSGGAGARPRGRGRGRDLSVSGGKALLNDVWLFR